MLEKVKKYLLIITFVLMHQVIESQIKVDSLIIVYDSLNYYSFVITKDLFDKNDRRETRYFVSTVEHIKNEFLNRLGNLPIKKERERIDSVRYWTEKNIYELNYKCRTPKENFKYPQNNYFYLKIMYLDQNCDSVPILEGQFYNGYILDLYNAGVYKEYDIKGRLKKEGNFYFSKVGARSVLINPNNVQFGPVPRKYKNENYGGEYIRSKKDGVWRFYDRGKLSSTIQYEKGEIIKK